MFSKSLIQFSVDECGCVPSLLFTWGQTMVEVMKIMATSFKRSHACTATLSAPALQQATTDPHLCWRLPDTQVSPRQVWVSPSMKVKVKSLSHVRLFATPWTIAYQVLLSKGFSRQEYWRGWPFPSPGNLPNPGIEPGSPAL